MCSNCWKLQKKKIQEDQDQQEGGGEESLVLQEEDQLLTMQLPLSLWYSTKKSMNTYSTTWENKYLSIYACHSLPNWLTDSCLVNLIDVTLACEDANSILVEVVTVAHVDAEDHVGNILL